PSSWATPASGGRSPTRTASSTRGGSRSAGASSSPRSGRAEMEPSFFAPAFEIHVDGTRAALDVEKSVTDLRVVLARDAMDEVSLTLANPYPTMRWTHTSDAALFAEGSGVAVRLGYVGSLEQLFDGEITSI